MISVGLTPIFLGVKMGALKNFVVQKGPLQISVLIFFAYAPPPSVCERSVSRLTHLIRTLDLAFFSLE